MTATPRTVIDKDRSILTVINEFNVTREQQEQIVRRFPPIMSDVVSKVPGSVSGNLHECRLGAGADYYQWQSEDAYDAFLGDEETAEKVSAVMFEYDADRRVYEVVFQVWGSSNAERR